MSERRHPFVEIGPDEVARMAGPWLAGRDLARVTRLSKGRINTNLRVDADDGRSAVLRLDPPQARPPEVERNLLEALPGPVPSPKLLHDGLLAARPHLLLSWVDGLDAEDAADGQTDSAVGFACGRALARLHVIAFPQFGYFERGLSITGRFPASASDYVQRMDAVLGLERTRTLLGEAYEPISSFVSETASLVDSIALGPCLVHSDFNGQNIRVAMDGATWRVSGILDWEFAHAGHPYRDLANFLRRRPDSRPALSAGFVAGYEATAGALPAGWRALAHFVDLYSMLMALRPEVQHAAILSKAAENATLLITQHRDEASDS